MTWWQWLLTIIFIIILNLCLGRKLINNIFFNDKEEGEE